MKMIVANWKMQLGLKASVNLARSLAKEKGSVVLCPSFPALESVSEALGKSGVQLGAQDVFFERAGAFTGEVSPEQLKELTCSHVIIGHSERRVLGETDAVVNKKVIAVLSAGLTPIICVGESTKERTSGKQKRVVGKQVKAALKSLHTRHQEQLIFAYEPLWAIGSGTPATPPDAAAMHKLIRKTALEAIKGLKPKQVKVLYGGSVNGKNAGGFLDEPEIDGLLVGGASLKAATFKPILNAAR